MGSKANFRRGDLKSFTGRVLNFCEDSNEETMGKCAIVKCWETLF